MPPALDSPEQAPTVSEAREIVFDARMIQSETMVTMSDNSSTNSEDFDDASDAEGHVEVKVEEDEKNEIRRIDCLRQLIIIALIVVGALLAGTTLVVLQNQVNAQVKGTANIYVDVVKNQIQDHSIRLVSALEKLGHSFIVHELMTNETFPAISLPLFEVVGKDARSNNIFDSVSFVPRVDSASRDAWERYSVSHQTWLAESWEIFNDETESLGDIIPYIHVGYGIAAAGEGPFYPVWQTSPPPATNLVNWDLSSDELISSALSTMNQMHGPVISDVILSSTGLATDYNASFEAPGSFILYPLPSSFEKNASKSEDEAAGVLVGFFSWVNYLQEIFRGSMESITVVLLNNCGTMITFQIKDGKVHFVGEGNLSRQTSPDATITVANENVGHGACIFSMHLFAVSSVQEIYRPRLPGIMAGIIVAIFLTFTLAFLLYDHFFTKTMKRAVSEAAKSHALVSSLFPQNVRDRLLGKDDNDEAESHSLTSRSQRSKTQTGKKRQKGLRTLLDEIPGSDFDEVGEEIFKTQPIADLFPSTTILFADIAGFTAWSSAREPAQVFTLLETLYHEFDKIARKRGVFKVETVGDCYVAVCGLPEPRRDHAVIMARFARDCLWKTKEITKKLELSLGPDTGDLCLRVGLHSGSVTGGVLRGEKSRFQLFGDSMNTASRIETTGEPGRIQISQDTADLLADAGKGSWFKKREDKVYAKGKGQLQTYWLKVGGRSEAVSPKTRSHSGSECHSHNGSESEFDSNYDSDSDEDLDTIDLLESMVSPRTARLISWNVEALTRLLKRIVAHRQKNAVESPDEHTTASWPRSISRSSSPLAEAEQCISFPEKFTDALVSDEDTAKVQLRQEVIDQLHDFVTNIAIMYRDIPFHNFEHASHVMMAIINYNARILGSNESERLKQIHCAICDPLASFACAIAALIHDTDHPGVTNAQLVRERAEITVVYKGSAAEQNSFELAWGLLMDENYGDLRATICSTLPEVRRFRQLVVHAVMATDVHDLGQNKLRSERWNTIVESNQSTAETPNATNMIATIVVELMVQAADVIHTMQHWQVYRKWNERLFTEMYTAYINGREDRDPSTTWYDNEIHFFDTFVVPLAKKLKDCGAFGPSSEEDLNYAIKNRQEWVLNGRHLVNEMLFNCRRMRSSSPNAFLPILEPRPSSPTSNRPVANADSANDYILQRIDSMNKKKPKGGDSGTETAQPVVTSIAQLSQVGSLVQMVRSVELHEGSDSSRFL